MPRGGRPQGGPPEFGPPLVPDREQRHVHVINPLRPEPIGRLHSIEAEHSESFQEGKAGRAVGEDIGEINDHSLGANERSPWDGRELRPQDDDH